MKYEIPTKLAEILQSPSVWREWIEIHDYLQEFPECEVSLRVEGVD